MAILESRVVAVIKGLALFGLFIVVDALIAGAISALMAGEPGTAPLTFRHALAAAVSSIAGVLAADAILLASFRGSYPRVYILNTLLVVVGVIFCLAAMVMKDKMFSADGVNTVSFLGTLAYLRWRHSKRPRIEVAADLPAMGTTHKAVGPEIVHSDQVPFLRGLANLAGGIAAVLPMVLFFVLGLVQLAAVVAQLHAVSHFPKFVCFIGGLFLTYVPVVGSIVGFFGAKDVWGWPWWQSALLYFGVPIVSFGLYMVVSLFASFASRTWPQSRRART